jgi:uncharacterized Zn-binding protein involved in type VI secretion
VGDKVVCPRCKKVGTILTGSHTHLIEGRPIARLGDLTTCGPILTGSHRYLIDGRPVARIRDKVGCSGHIVTASMEYLIE